MNSYLFLAVGFLLIFLEFYLPGAILGVLGGILVAASIFLFVAGGASPLGIVLYIIGVVIGLVVVIKLAMWRIRIAKPTSSIFSDASQTGYYASSYDKEMVGKNGVVVTDLKPGGHILIEGKRYQAISLAGYLVKGEEITVVGGQEESLLVRPVMKFTKQ